MCAKGEMKLSQNSIKIKNRVCQLYVGSSKINLMDSGKVHWDK